MTHEPFDIPEKYLELYDDDYKDHILTCQNIKIDVEIKEAIEHLKKRYKALVTMSDVHFGRFIEKLKKIICMKIL